MMNELIGETFMTGRTVKSSEPNLLELMEICSNMYLTHLLAVEILGESQEDFSGLGESPWISAILSLDAPAFLKRLMQIH